MRVLRTLGATLLAALLLTGAAGCGGGGSDEPESLEFGTEKGDLNPEDVRASDSEVAAGFAELTEVVTAVEAKLGTDPDAALDAQEKILPLWESILGTVKAHDPAAYDTLSEAFAFLTGAAGDASRASISAAAAAVRATAMSYLTVYPAGAPTEEPATGGY